MTVCDFEHPHPDQPCGRRLMRCPDCVGGTVFWFYSTPIFMPCSTCEGTGKVFHIDGLRGG